MTASDSQAKRSRPVVRQLRVADISKKIGSKRIVNAVSFHVDSGEIIGLLGPNGAGKTTCFHMVVGLHSCDRGAVYIDGYDITSLPIFSRAKLGIGYLPQESSIFRRLNVEDNIKAVLQTRRDLNNSAQTKRLEDILSLFRIERIRKQAGTTLSGGERRRVEIARAFALEPRFILLDEPFAGVDPIAVEEVVSLIRLLTQLNVGVLITDHNVRETLGICTRAYIMNQGSVIVYGSAEEILNDQTVKNIYLGEKFRI